MENLNPADYVEQIGDVWHVKLHPSHFPYQSVQLKRRHGDDVTRVIIAPTEKVIQLYENENPSFIIPPVSKWPVQQADGIKDFLDPIDGAPEMPNLSPLLRQVEHYEKRLLVFKRKIVSEVRAITFTNGRHRTRYLHAAGAKFIPVETFKGQAKQLIEFLQS